MTDRFRVAITIATALALGAFRYGHAFDINPPGVLHVFWDTGWLIYGLAILGVFLVYRWWALLSAIAPAAATVYLYKMTDYAPPWGEESAIGDSDQPVVYALFVIGGIVLEAAILSVGLLLRAAWELVRSGRHKGSLPGSA